VQRLGSKTFDLPAGSAVYFYGPDGATLLYPGYTAICGTNPITPYGDPVTGACPDYSLGK